MRQFIIGLLFITFCNSCSIKIEDNREKEILEIVLKDRIKLNSSTQIIQKTNDSIKINNLTLIKNANDGFVIDSVNNRFVLPGGRCFSLSYSFFTDSINYYESQIKDVSPVIWDTTGLYLNIEVDSPMTELGDSIKHKTLWWITENIGNKSFLQISKPIYNLNDKALIETEITLEDYVIKKFFLLGKSNDSWQIEDFETVILKYTEPEIEEWLGEDGIIHRTEKSYLVILGFYHI